MDPRISQLRAKYRECCAYWRRFVCDSKIAVEQSIVQSNNFGKFFLHVNAHVYHAALVLATKHKLVMVIRLRLKAKQMRLVFFCFLTDTLPVLVIGTASLPLLSLLLLMMTNVCVMSLSRNLTSYEL